MANKTAEFKPGEKVPTSGVYDVAHDKIDGELHAHPHQVTVISGTHFPPCRGCGHGVRFHLHQAAEHIGSHALFQAKG